MMESDKEGKKKIMKVSFKEYREYCLKVESSLNELEGYSAKYHVSTHKFLKEHDGQHLEILYRGSSHIIKINLCYSIAYQVPTFYFMVYDEESQPLKIQTIYQKFMDKGESRELHPGNEQHGTYLSQNPITRQYFYTLHHCQMSMKIDHLIPFYFSLLNLHPPLILN